MTIVNSLVQKGNYRTRNRPRLWSHTTQDGQWFKTGSIATSFGFVHAYQDAKSYTFDFIWNGTEYTCRKNESISELALVKRASKFANSVVGQRMLQG